MNSVILLVQEYGFPGGMWRGKLPHESIAEEARSASHIAGYMAGSSG